MIKPAERPGCWFIKCPNLADHEPCCSSHGHPLCHACYRRTHFVEVCDCGRPNCGPVEPVADTEAVEADPNAAYDAWTAALHNRDFHWVRWTPEQDYVRGEIVCEGPDDAGCRYYCAEGCAVYPCEHPPTLGKTCGVVPRFDDGPECCCYSGPVGVPVRDGLIKLGWNGECYEWHYAESRPVASSSTREDGETTVEYSLVRDSDGYRYGGYNEDCRAPGCDCYLTARPEAIVGEEHIEQREVYRGPWRRAGASS